MHTHESAGTVIGSIDQPLVAISQGGCLLHNEVGYHGFEGLADQSDEVPRILHDLGNKHALVMRNHGLLSVGASVGEAFGWMRTLIDECRLIERALATGKQLRTIPEAVQIHTKSQMEGVLAATRPETTTAGNIGCALLNVSIRLLRTDATSTTAMLHRE